MTRSGSSLADCTHYRQTLLARPRRFVHATALACASLLAAALAWAAMTPVAEVARAPGWVRARGGSSRLVCPGGELCGTAEGVRVAAVNCRPGQKVRRGELLVTFDCAHLDGEIARHEQLRSAGERELKQMAALHGAASAQHAAQRRKAQADLNEALLDRQQAELRRQSALRLALDEYEKAKADYDRYQQLERDNTVTDEDLGQKRLDMRSAEEGLRNAELRTPAGKIDSLRRLLELEDANHRARTAELTLKRHQKQGEVEAARLELARLARERSLASLRAPRDGVVVKGELRRGDFLRRGETVLTISGGQTLLFEAAVPTADAGLLRKGMQVRIKLAAFDYQRYGALAGRVSFVAPDAEAAHDDDRTAQSGSSRRPAAYLVRVALDRTELGRGALRGQARMGMEGTAEIVTGWRSLLAVVVGRVRRSISLG